MAGIREFDVIYKEMIETSKIIKEVIIPWIKGIVIFWLAISLVFYLLSGNLTVFYAFGVSLLAFGLPYLVIECLRKKRKWKEQEK